MSYLFENPKLNASIVFKKNEHSHLVRDTKTMSTFSIGKREFEILKSLDGNLNIQQLKDKLSNIIDGKELEKFLLLIQSNGLLEDSSASIRKRNFMQLKKPIIKDFNFVKKGKLSKWLTRLITLGPFFTIVILFILRDNLALIATHTLMTDYLRLDTIPYYFLSIFILGLLHESAHAITIINAGGNVFEMGFILNYFHPAFYVDITGVSRIRDKNKRLVVWIAGICIQMLLLGPFLCLTYLPQSYFYQSYFLQIFNAVNMGMIFFNLLFLIKLDGYYILCEFLEISDLKERSLSYLNLPQLPSINSLNFLYLIIGIIYKIYVPLFIVNFIILLINNIVPHIAERISMVMLICILISLTIKIVLNLLKHTKMKGDYNAGFLRL